jgi:hypothetical protein
MKYEEQAKKAYANDPEERANKAIAAGRAIDNALELEYTKGGTTNSHFMMSNYLKYFSYEALGTDRIKLLWNI